MSHTRSHAPGTHVTIFMNVITRSKSGQSKSPKPLGSDDTTKATLWIESRKSRSPRNSPKPSQEPPPRNSLRNACKPGESPRLSRKRSSTAPTVSPRSVSKVPRLSARGTPRVSTKSAPLRLAVLKRAHSAQYRVTKIQAPLKIGEALNLVHIKELD